MPSPIFFIHPPKSGGSTVISFFDLNKGKDDFVNFEWDRDGWENCRKQLIASSVGGGHQSFGMHRSLKIPLRYCTILRDPLARQISHYWYAYNGKNGEVARGASVGAPEALVRRGAISLDEWVAESLAGKNIFVHMLSGHPVLNDTSLNTARANLRQHIGTPGVCENMSEFLLRLCGKTGLKLPFYFETNKTNGSPKGTGNLSEAARQKFIEDNQADYALFHETQREIEKHAAGSGPLFARALEQVKAIQAEINRLDNPYLHSSTVFGFDQTFLSKVMDVVRQFDLSPINAYLESAREQQAAPSDMYDGFVDAVRDGVVSGWVVNFTRPEQPVLIEVRVGAKVVAQGWSGEHRPDVAAAGYPSSYSGFSIPLPPDASDGFQINIANSAECLHNAGIWRQGWHCA